MARYNDEIHRMGGNGRRSACVVYGGLVYLSGITTVDLQADILGQTRDVLAQIDKLLAASGSGKSRVLSANVTLRAMEDYGGFNAAWDEWITDGLEPARNVVQGGLAIPEYLVKIALIAAQ
jgi:enamine deaminase RidA (YjgF/YER057c/UK114 family)